LKGTEFPQNIILGYRYVRIYAYRHNNKTSISICYEDTQGNTADVDVDIQFENGTSVSGTYPYTYSDTTYFNHTWSNALYNTTYLVVVDITHSKYGEMPYRTILARAWSSQPWVLPFGSIPGMNSGDLIPIFLIFICFAVFSQANAYVGVFSGTMLAIILTWLGWISIPSGMLVTAITFTILLGFKYAKQRSYEY